MYKGKKLIWTSPGDLKKIYSVIWEWESWLKLGRQQENVYEDNKLGNTLYYKNVNNYHLSTCIDILISFFHHQTTNLFNYRNKKNI
jgi:hypothetical protein